MKKMILAIGVLLIGGHVMSEIHGFLVDIFPNIDEIKVDLFWSKSFQYKISVHWYIKMLMDDLFLVMCFYIMAKISSQYSEKLFLICSIYMLYHMVDAICFMYNYKETREIYLALIICSTASVYVLIKPKKNNLKIVR